MANSRKDHRPTCRLCGAKHFSHEPHAFDKTVEAPKKEPQPKSKKKKTVKKSAKKTASTDVARVQDWRERNRDHYNRYMRSYMRKKRAKS